MATIHSKSRKNKGEGGGMRGKLSGELREAELFAIEQSPAGRKTARKGSAGKRAAKKRTAAAIAHTSTAKARAAVPKRPKVKYCKIGFSISEKEKNELLRFCERDNIALKALYKKAVRLYVKERSEQLRKEEELSENQLDLFKPIPYQTKLNF